MNFRQFLENQEYDSAIEACLQARRQWGICGARTAGSAKGVGAVFGDCKETAKGAVALLQRQNRNARLAHGYFIADPAEDESWEHTWIEIDDYILDPTVDQFFSSLDIDLYTTVQGIYFSHPEWDGDSLKERYQY